MAELYEKAEAFARFHHGSQKDKVGEAYIYHPLTIAECFEDEIVKVAAVLHDVVEDTKVTLNDIAIEFGEEVAKLVDNLTRRENESKQEALVRSLQDPRSAAIKIADTLHNGDCRRWKDKLDELDVDFVGSYLDKTVFLLTELGIFGNSKLLLLDQQVPSSYGLEKQSPTKPPSVTKSPLNNSRALLSDEQNLQRDRALETIARSNQLPPDNVVVD